MTNLIRRLRAYDPTYARTFGPTFDNSWDVLLRWDPFAGDAVAAPARGFSPDFEVKEVKDGYLIKADLPGFAEADVDVTVAGNALTISGKREAEKTAEAVRYHATERSYGAFSRAFVLPDGTNLDDLKADLTNGVLTVRVPKRPEVQPRKIALGGGQPKASA